MRKKIAIIKSDQLRGCPFGLEISSSCETVGEAVNQMEVLDNVPEEQREKYARANRRVYRHHQDGTRCPFAEHILEGRDMVDCDFEEIGGSAGVHDPVLTPSPYYPRVMSGLGQAGLYAWQLGSYQDAAGDVGQPYPGMMMFYASDSTSKSTPPTNKTAQYHEFPDSELAEKNPLEEN